MKDQIFSKIKIISFLILVLLVSLKAIETGAQITQVQPAPTVEFLPALARVINIIFTILLIAAVIMLIWGGIMFVTAAGDENKVAQARSLIIWAAVGIIIGILAYGIVYFLRTQITGY